MTTGTCVFLVDGNVGSALQLVRELSRIGVQTIAVGDARAMRLLRASRHCHATVTVDAEFGDLSDAIAGLAAAGESGPIPVLPLSDRLVGRLLELDLPAPFASPLPAASVIRPLLSKPSAFLLADRAGLSVPPWVELVEPGDALSDTGLAFPVCLRPTDSLRRDTPFKVAVVHSARQLAERAGPVLVAGHRLVAQHYVGDPVASTEFAITWRGRSAGHPVAVCTGRKRRESAPEGGVMAWGTAEPLPDVAASARRFLEASNYVGLGGAEFIRQGDTLWFVEFNPRLEAIHFLAEAAGVPTATMEYRELAAQLPPSVDDQRPAAAWVGSAWLERLRRRPQDLAIALADRVRFARCSPRASAIWSWRDPGPGLLLTGQMASTILKRASRR